MNVAEAADTCEDVLAEIGTAVIGERTLFETILTAVVGQGHVLVEDVPGTGKTLTAHTLATALDLEFTRIQFTPDLLPADITGTHVYDEHAGEFSFEPGPIFANVVLADEINRAPPKTQAALLEAMGEGQVSIGGETRDLPDLSSLSRPKTPSSRRGPSRCRRPRSTVSWSKRRWGIPTVRAISNCSIDVPTGSPGRQP